MLSQVGIVDTQGTSSVVLVVELEVESTQVSRHSDHRVKRRGGLDVFLPWSQGSGIQSEAGGNLCASCRVIGAMIR